MAKISLKDDQYNALTKAYFAKRSQRKLLNKTESIQIAERLNEKVSLPFLSEQKEHAVLVKIIIKIDNYLYEHLPNEIYELIHNIDEGFDDSEAAQLAARLSKQAHDDISLPFLTSHVEYYSITFVLTLIINAMREGSDLEHAINVTQHPRMMCDDFPFPGLL
ncbi:hypothetical protein WNY58_06310 [Neptuniibacter pectenicola]|jgi:hypothetical protein|uniref:Uncharacterized protein n=1 Tax=Neptuniibacter pectenicola TaxID=1806669 RepID=A0ABU9TQK2_9GAMM|nr:hypothetical protein [Neptuniibacter pectenicola]KXJ50298.1 MAG: hypothetical protein AXW15_05435 [Neptuniibacter sp. Phe_28]|tara:strand:+ start:2625 stop:3113 length:489 start_codon:yes stop_codon:yes gene_type:complete